MSIYDSLNEMQKKAVFQTEGPVLILAGAGSGKTRVLTHRIAYLIEEKGVNPWNILAITFTNKAAGEMRERVDHLVGFGSESIWVSTFHSACVRILRRFIDRLGYDTNFTIYDTDDQKSLMKEVCKYLQIDTKTYRERALLSAISSAKNEMISPQEFLLQAEGDFSKQKIAEVYLEYEKQLRANNALDFDDLLVRTVQLFETQPDVLDYYQERFRYIMVDEYQDTNTVQFHLIRILSSKYRNLCVVGDDDQSIYKFRGANIKNILNFESEFPDATVIKLEQNYRSTSNILNAANAVIHNNIGRKDKTLWTENPEGEKIACKQFDNAYDEADYIAAAIQKKVKEERASYKDCAVLYRTNAQSRMFEERFVSTNIPYKVIGGVNFYARREIKDLLAYLRTIENGRDDLAVRRIINVPKRGIGLTSINRVQEYALQKETGFYEALLAADLIPGIGRALSKESEIFAVIKPSNSYETCQLIISRYGKAERAARSWNPTADDLTADDWNYSGDELRNKVCKEDKSNLRRCESMDYEKFRLQVRDLATKAYKDLKEESKDYGELRQKCKKYCTGLLYRDKDMGNYVKGCFEKLFIHDLRDAQITHLSD